ncbi:hypothetical protein E4U43_002214 [Claviceps pusilla]|uniref:Uncharacterized protein n=1 Tax=Claviceps pusilla TaxID=123648 RepID=A0A9P7N8Z3_9HYPO|nr:hypothetical protein E4U43_002214 [Claviceps pusilla]
MARSLDRLRLETAGEGSSGVDGGREELVNKVHPAILEWAPEKVLLARARRWRCLGWGRRAAQRAGCADGYDALRGDIVQRAAWKKRLLFVLRSVMRRPTR